MVHSLLFESSRLGSYENVTDMKWPGKSGLSEKRDMTVNSAGCHETSLITHLEVNFPSYVQYLRCEKDSVRIVR